MLRLDLATKVLKVVVLLSLALALLSLARALYVLPDAVVAAIAREGQLTREAIVQSVDRLSVRADAAIERTSSEMTRTLLNATERVRTDLNRHLSAALRLADDRTRVVSSVVERAQRSLEDSTDQLNGLIAEAKNTVSSTNSLVQHADRAVTLMTPQVLGAVAAGKVLAGEAASTARTWRRETPAIAANVRETTENVKRASSLSRWQKMLLLGAAALAVVSAVR